VLAGSFSWPPGRDQPATLISLHETGGLQCGQRAKAGRNTDTGGQCNVSDAGLPASRDGFEDC
jgi:hypothetical protein